jgi:hypothetical protein
MDPREDLIYKDPREDLIKDPRFLLQYISL